jgi:hypothetical protein
MATRIQLSERITGSFREEEDWFYFVIDDDGSKYVEHEWSFLDKNGSRPSASGCKRIPVEEFLRSEYGQGVKESLRYELERSKP